MQNWRPERKVSPFYQVLAVGIAAFITALMALDPIGAALGAIVFVVYFILFALHPFRSDVVRPQREGFSPVLLGLALVSAVPLLWFALTTARLQRDGLDADPHVQQGHWYVMATMAVAIVLTAALASLKFPGWHISAWSAAGALFIYGLASTVYPDFAGSEGIGWGLVAMAGGVLFAALAAWEWRRAPAALERIPA